MESFSFEDLGLDELSLQAARKKGFEEPTPIQILAIPRLLNGEANVVARARTGTGKTAAFGFPIIQRLRSQSDIPRALILTPTRELALQVSSELISLKQGKFPRTEAVYGGQSMGAQLRALRNGTEIIVGTPGRIKDHLDRGSLDISQIDFFILDEADEMLDMGFIEDIEDIFGRANKDCRVLMFSATMPPPILEIAKKFMGDYEIVEEETDEVVPTLTEQRYMIVYEADKTEALLRIIDTAEDFYGLVFCQTKADADALAKSLDERGCETAALHGDVPQAQREKILERFRRKKTRILAATDVAARGIDIEGLTHVINYSLPYDGASYIHRIGRTGRAGATGKAVTFARPDERRRLSYFIRITKGELKEEKTPEISEVMQIRKARLLNKLRGAVQARAEAEKSETDGNSSVFDEWARDLCAERDPQTAVAAILEYFCGEELSARRYRHIKPIYSRENGGGNFNAGNRERAQIVQPGKTRLYISLGRRDNVTKRDIADFFSGLLGLPQRLVDDIDLAESFSLATLPSAAAARALEISRKQKGVPHMHIDARSEQRERRRPGKSGANFSRGQRAAAQ